MSSQAQIDANRENSKLSTGPNTPEGKAASARNSRTHGFSSPSVIIPPECEPLFHAFEARFEEEYQPATDAEGFYFRRMVHAAWAIESIDATEAASFTDLATALSNDEQEKFLSRLARYRGLHFRLFELARKAFVYEQTQRALREQVANPAEPKPLSEAPPKANLSVLIAFAKRSQIGNRFPSFTREQVDQLDAKVIETQHMNAEVRKKKLERDEEISLRKVA